MIISKDRPNTLLEVRMSDALHSLALATMILLLAELISFVIFKFGLDTLGTLDEIGDRSALVDAGMLLSQLFSSPRLFFFVERAELRLASSAPSLNATS